MDLNHNIIILAHSMSYTGGNLFSVVSEPYDVVEIPLFHHGIQPQLIFMMTEIKSCLGFLSLV